MFAWYEDWWAFDFAPDVYSTLIERERLHYAAPQSQEGTGQAVSRSLLPPRYYNMNNDRTALVDFLVWCVREGLGMSTHRQTTGPAPGGCDILALHCAVYLLDACLQLWEPNSAPGHRRAAYFRVGTRGRLTVDSYCLALACLRLAIKYEDMEQNVPKIQVLFNLMDAWFGKIRRQMEKQGLETAAVLNYNYQRPSKSRTARLLAFENFILEQVTGWQLQYNSPPLFWPYLQPVVLSRDDFEPDQLYHVGGASGVGELIDLTSDPTPGAGASSNYVYKTPDHHQRLASSCGVSLEGDSLKPPPPPTRQQYHDLAAGCNGSNSVAPPRTDGAGFMDGRGMPFDISSRSLETPPLEPPYAWETRSWLNSNLQDVVEKIMELSLRDFSACRKYPPSLTAAATVAVARFLLMLEPVWTDSLRLRSAYRATDLRAVGAGLLILVATDFELSPGRWTRWLPNTARIQENFRVTAAPRGRQPFLPDSLARAYLRAGVLGGVVSGGMVPIDRCNGTNDVDVQPGQQDRMSVKRSLDDASMLAMNHLIWRQNKRVRTSADDDATITGYEVENGSSANNMTTSDTTVNGFPTKLSKTGTFRAVEGNQPGPPKPSFLHPRPIALVPAPGLLLKQDGGGGYGVDANAARISCFEKPMPPYVPPPSNLDGGFLFMRNPDETTGYNHEETLTEVAAAAGNQSCAESVIAENAQNLGIPTSNSNVQTDMGLAVSYEHSRKDHENNEGTKAMFLSQHSANTTFQDSSQLENMTEMRNLVELRPQQQFTQNDAVTASYAHTLSAGRPAPSVVVPIPTYPPPPGQSVLEPTPRGPPGGLLPMERSLSSTSVLSATSNEEGVTGAGQAPGAHNYYSTAGGSNLTAILPGPSSSAATATGTTSGSQEFLQAYQQPASFGNQGILSLNPQDIAAFLGYQYGMSISIASQPPRPSMPHVVGTGAAGSSTLVGSYMQNYANNPSQHILPPHTAADYHYPTTSKTSSQQLPSSESSQSHDREMSLGFRGGQQISALGGLTGAGAGTGFHQIGGATKPTGPPSYAPHPGLPLVGVVNPFYGHSAGMQFPLPPQQHLLHAAPPLKPPDTSHVHPSQHSVANANNTSMMQMLPISGQNQGHYCPTSTNGAAMYDAFQGNSLHHQSSQQNMTTTMNMNSVVESMQRHNSQQGAFFF